jgi:hypothetical protein
MVQQQLDRWTEVKAENNIKQDKIKLLVAGKPFITNHLFILTFTSSDCPVWVSCPPTPALT